MSKFEKFIAFALLTLTLVSSILGSLNDIHIFNLFWTIILTIIISLILIFIDDILKLIGLENLGVLRKIVILSLLILLWYPQYPQISNSLSEPNNKKLETEELPVNFLPGDLELNYSEYNKFSPSTSLVKIDVESISEIIFLTKEAKIDDINIDDEYFVGKNIDILTVEPKRISVGKEVKKTEIFIRFDVSNLTLHNVHRDRLIRQSVRGDDNTYEFKTFGNINVKIYYIKSNGEKTYKIVKIRCVFG